MNRERHSIRIFDSSDMGIAWVPGRIGHPDHSISIIVKGVFSLRADEAMARVQNADCALNGGMRFAASPDASLFFDSDFAFFKPKADITLVGSCHAPDGKPTKACPVALGVGEWKRTLQVVGDRWWDKGISGNLMTEPAPFVSMPLRFENAFGGEGFDHNPVGKGISAIDCEDGKRRIPLPNIEDPREMISSPAQRPAPVCFGPVAPQWRPRCRGWGTYDAEWLETRWPWFPKDLDWSFFNSAPIAQQFDGYLRGDEMIALQNLVAGRPDFRSRLPGLKVRALIRRNRAETNEDTGLEEVGMNLDTLWINSETGELVLVWRGHAATVSEFCDDIDSLYVFTERLEDRPVSMEEACRELTRGPEIATESSEPAYTAADIGAGNEQVEAEIAEAQRDSAGNQAVGRDGDPIAVARSVYREQLVRMGKDPAPADTWTPPQDPESERMLAEIEERFGSAFPEDDEPLDRAACLERAAATGSLADLDLRGIDLSNCDLGGVDFSGSLLAGVDFAGARLARAILRNADLSAAVFDNADLRAVDACRADFSGARMMRANLQEAKLDHARLCDVILREARMQGVQATRADFSRADLVDAVMEGGNFREADFTGCRMGGASLASACLVGAHLETSFGTGAVFTSAEMTGAILSRGCRFLDADFSGIRADESIWEGAELVRCDFSGARMRGADFTLAVLTEAVLRCCDLASARFDDASLVSADLENANLFQARLERVDLSNANLRGVNLYEAETRGARLEKVELHGANLKMTKLAWQAPLH